MSQPNRFQKLVLEAKTRVNEVAPGELPSALQSPKVLLIDVREEKDFRESHAQGAIHLSRGMIETEIEDLVPDLETPIICYCGGGSRSALVADSLQKMGYTNVRSLAGGFRAYKAAGLPIAG